MGRRTVRRTLLRPCACAAAMFGLGCSATEPEVETPIIEEPPIITNGGFELGNALPDFWDPTVVERTSQYVTFAWDGGERHSGRRSARLSILPNHPPDLISYNWTQPITLGFWPGRTYELEAWVKTLGVPQRAFVTVQFWDSAESTLLGVATAPADGSATAVWTRVAVSFRVPDATRRMRIRAGLAAPTNAGGTAWFDDISLRLVDGPPPRAS